MNRGMASGDTLIHKSRDVKSTSLFSGVKYRADAGSVGHVADAASIEENTILISPLGEPECLREFLSVTRIELPL